MALSQEQQKQFIKDYKSGVKVSELTKKYKVSNDAYTYNMIYNLRKLNLIPAAKKSSVDHAERMKKAWETRKANKANMIKTTDNVTTEVTNKPVTDYRTVFFKDFSVQIHKKAMARLVVDHNNNLHILNN